MLRKQSIVFRNPHCIISDQNTVFTSNDFRSYCKEENIEQVLITIKTLRTNGQIERINHILIPLLIYRSKTKSDINT